MTVQDWSFSRPSEGELDSRMAELRGRAWLRRDGGWSLQLDSATVAQVWEEDGAWSARVGGHLLGRRYRQRADAEHAVYVHAAWWCRWDDAAQDVVA